MPTESTALSEQITCSIRYFSRNKGFYFGWLDYIYIYINGWLDVLKYAVEHGKRRWGPQSSKFPGQGPGKWAQNSFALCRTIKVAHLF